MSDFGMFEADEAAGLEPRVAAKTAARKLEAAIDEVRAKFGRFLLGATGIDEFGDRWHYSKHDIRKTVEPYVFPNTGTMRRIQNAMKQDWKLAHPYKLSLSHDEAGFGSMPTADTERNQNLKKTYHPSDGNLIPEGDFHGYKDSVDQGGPEKVDAHNFTPGGDSGLAKRASRRVANPTKGFAQHLVEQGIDPHSLLDDQENLNDHLADYINGHPGLSDGDAIDHYDQIVERLSTHGFDDDLPGSDRRAAKKEFCPGCEKIHTPGKCLDSSFNNPEDLDLDESDFKKDKKEAAMLVADIYTDFAQANGLRVASLDTLDHYAATGIAEADYRLLQSMIVRQAEADCDDSDDEDDSEDDSESSSESDSSDSSDSDSNSEAPKSSESDDESDDDSDDAPDFGGEDTDDDGDHDDADHHEDFGGGDVGQTFTVPEHAPELDPQMMGEIPQNDTDGSAPIPPEVVDSLLGLPPGTIEQLLLEEVSGGAPQGGGDDFLGGGGGDADQPPPDPRMARRRQAGGPDWPTPPEIGTRVRVKNPNYPDGHYEDVVRGFSPEDGAVILDGGELVGNHLNPEEYSRFEVIPHRQAVRTFWAAPDESEEELTERQKREQKDAIDTKHESWSKSKAARRFWAAEGDQEQAPAQDPAAAGGMDPNAMAQAGGQMLPPPGAAAVQPPAPPAPIENQPAEDQLLDMANQAISQMIDRETAEFQQIIDPLSQALQAVQFAQQVEQAEHPLDVTPPQGTVNVDPSQAPAAQANPMQQQAARRRRRQANGDDPYAQPYGTVDRGGPSIDDPTNGPSYQGVHPDISKALQNRFEGGGRGVWHPEKPGVILHNLGNFWDGPREVKHLGGGELEYTNPWNGDSDRFNADGYYNRKNEHVPWNPEDRYASRREAKKADILRKAAYVIARQHGISEEGYRMLVAATLGRRDYEHILEAVRLAHPADREKVGDHLSHLFAAGNPRFNKDAFMKAVMAGTARERYQDKAYSGPRDKRREEHGRQDMDDRGDLNHPMFWFQGEEPPVKPGPENPDHAYYHASRGRLPFDRPRRTAGETWVHHSIPDTFEFENDVPQSRDNMTINDLPKMPGGHVGSSQRVVDRFQRWQQYRQQNGLPATDGEAGIHNFLQTTKPYKSKVGDEAEAMLHRNEGLQPDAKPAPRVKVPKAVNPVLKGKGTKTPAAPKPKAPKVKAASFFTRKVPGWRWDDHLNGYISKEGKAFTCTCGQKVAAPSYKSCDCGKIWNVYAIGDTHHLASDSAEMFIAREIPVRDNVIMANRKLAAPDRWFEHEQEELHRQRQKEEDDADAWAEKRMNTPHRDDGAYREASHKQAKDGECTCWEGYERVPGTEPCASKSCRKKTSARAEAAHRELLAVIDRYADWTKYDDIVDGEDPVAQAYGKTKVPSTKSPKIPRDWAKRNPDGKWKNTNFAPKKK